MDCPHQVDRRTTQAKLISIVVICILYLVYTANRIRHVHSQFSKLASLRLSYDIAQRKSRFRLEEKGASEGVGGAGAPFFLRRPYPI